MTRCAGSSTTGIRTTRTRASARCCGGARGDERGARGGSAAMSEGRLFFDAELKAAQEFWIARIPREPGDSGLPLDAKRSRIHSPRKESLAVEIPGEARRRLAKLAGGSPLLTYTTLLAALQV